MKNKHRNKHPLYIRTYEPMRKMKNINTRIFWTSPVFKNKYWYETLKYFESNPSLSFWKYHSFTIASLPIPRSGSPLLQILSSFSTLDTIQTFPYTSDNTCSWNVVLQKQSTHLIWICNLRKKINMKITGTSYLTYKY